MIIFIIIQVFSFYKQLSRWWKLNTDISIKNIYFLNFAKKSSVNNSFFFYKEFWV